MRIFLKEACVRGVQTEVRHGGVAPAGSLKEYAGRLLDIAGKVITLFLYPYCQDFVTVQTFSPHY